MELGSCLSRHTAVTEVTAACLAWRLGGHTWIAEQHSSNKTQKSSKPHTL